MRAARASAATALLLLLGGCGYVGPVVPPSPQIPSVVSDLTAVERGDRIDISFGTPTKTLDALPIDEFSRVELRVGAAPEPFDWTRWEQGSTLYPVNVRYVGGEDEESRSVAVNKEVPVSAWQGQTIAVSVRTAVKKHGHDSAWAKPVILHVVEPIPPPNVTVQASAEGYRLQWTAAAPGGRFRILRLDPGAAKPEIAGTSDKSEFVDGTSRWNTRYEYRVVQEKGGAESLPSKAIAVMHADTFPPAVPVGLVALAAPDSIELTWTRDTEPDLKGYLIFRSEGGGPFRRLGDLQNLPAYSDRDVQRGKSYRYAVSAVDQSGNTSDNSAPAEVRF